MDAATVKRAEKMYADAAEATREATKGWTEADWLRWLQNGAKAVSPTGKPLGRRQDG